MMHVHEPFSRTCLRDDCPTSSQMLSMILKMSSMWTTSSAWVASRHDRKPLLVLLLFVVVVFLFLLTRSNRPQPIVIQSQHFLAIITVTCCMEPVCVFTNVVNDPQNVIHVDNIIGMSGFTSWPETIVGVVVVCCCCFSFSFNQKQPTSTHCNTISTFPCNYHCNVLHGTCLRAGVILYSVPVLLRWSIICVVWTLLNNVMFASHLQILHTCILMMTRLKWTIWRIRNHASSK